MLPLMLRRPTGRNDCSFFSVPIGAPRLSWNKSRRRRRLHPPEITVIRHASITFLVKPAADGGAEVAAR